MRKWYTYARNGIIYVQFKDRLTGKKLTAKSTRTRIKTEAENIIQQWYHDPDSFFNNGQKNTAKSLLKDILKDSILSETDICSVLNAAINETFKVTRENIVSVTQSNKNSIRVTKRKIKDVDIQILYDKLDTLTFKEFVLVFFDYDNSPYIKQLKRLGKKTPEPERFNTLLSSFRKYENAFPDILLTEIDAEDINAILGAIRNKGQLMESTMNILRSAIIEVMTFAHNNRLVECLITGGLTKFSNVSREKEIFTEEELNIIFNKNKNVFKNEHFLLINKLLLKTGCRVGEILALQIGDVQKTVEGYNLFIGKSYNPKGRRLKATKTNREDFVPISYEMGEDLLHFIETNPYKNAKDGFIFYSRRKNYPISYSQVYENFNKTMKALGIYRKALTLHSYRHTYASILQDEGFSNADLLYLTRHKDIKQVLRYSNHITPVKEKKKRQAAEIIEKFA